MLRLSRLCYINALSIRILVLSCSIFFSTNIFAQVELWGITPIGGDSGNGAIFKYSNGSVVNIHSFLADHTGENPERAKLLQASNGKWYGTTHSGGRNNGGVIFEYDAASGAYEVLHHFDNMLSAEGTGPYNGVIQASNGKLYGTAGEALYEFDISSKSYKVVHHFTYTTGSAASLVRLAELEPNKIYGTAAGGGDHLCGVLFEFDISTSTYTPKFHFTEDVGIKPVGGVMKASNGKYYGLTYEGGQSYYGTIYEYDPTTNTATYLRSFGSNSDVYINGSAAESILVEHPNGKLYGVTPAGGYPFLGNLFEYDIASNTVTQKVLFTPEFHTWTAGSVPLAGLTLASNGKFYGATTGSQTWGSGGSGIIYEYDPITNSFSYITGIADTKGALTQGADGKLYGLTNNSGFGRGEFYSYDIDTKEIVRPFFFDDTPDGANPYGKLTQAFNGNFYGITYNTEIGCNTGIIFKVDSQTEQFSTVAKVPCIDSFLARSGFVLHPNGKMYCITTDLVGSIIEFDPGIEEVTNVFKIDDWALGFWSLSEMTLSPDGMFYGATTNGGNSNLGVIFKYDPVNHLYTKLVDFSAEIGKHPKGGLAFGKNGKLYGTTSEGGSESFGVLFEFDPATNSLSKKADFTPTTGTNPEGTLTLGQDGLLYGLSVHGGPGGIGAGMIFKYDTETEKLSDAYYFLSSVGCPIGGSLIQDASGIMYGMTWAGGLGFGAIFQFDPSTSTMEPLYFFDGFNGANPQNVSLSFRNIVLKISEQQSNSIDIFPNPTSGKFEIEGTYESVVVLNMFAEIVFQNYDIADSSVDLSHVPAGVYLVECTNGKKRSLVRVVKY